MSPSLKILHLEDRPEDAEIAQSLFRSEGINCEITLTQGRDDFVRALQEKEFDLIISDYNLPSFNGMTALKIVRKKNTEIPFIFLSGMMGEDAAIESLLSGATDYVLKEKIARFIPAVKRAIEEAEIRRSQKRAEKEMKKTIEIRSEFISIVSHELRTPLTIIKEGVSIVLDGTDGSVNDEQKKHLQLATKNIDRMTRLINSVLDYQRLESGKAEFIMRPYDLNEIVRDAVENFMPVFKKKELELKLQLAAGLPLIWCDRDRLTEVMVNLLNNASKFTEKGCVTVATSQEGPWMRVSVRDQGIGIKEEDHSKLFQGFSQLSDGERCKSNGTGLGLAISKRIVEKHRGRIEVKSVYRQGTDFSFLLPIQSTQPVNISKKILIVDDETDIKDILEDRLSRAGYEVTAAVNGQEALDQLGRYIPKLILLDYRMPILNGHEVCRRIKADERLKGIPVIFLTASPQAATPEIMQSIGADDYLIKPFETSELFEKIAHFLGE